jgi:ribosome production factor 2
MQSTYFGEKHAFNPFEDITAVEELSKKYDQALFAFCSHNKKRPNNVILGKSLYKINCTHRFSYS